MNAEARQSNVPVGPLVAAIGAVLLIVSLFLNWYEPDVEGFTVFEFLDLLLVLLALATIASLAGGLGLLRPGPPPVVSLGVALFAVFLVVSQILNDPPAVAFTDGIDKDIGIWLALAGSALMVVGALLANARISLAVESRPRPPAADGHDAEGHDAEPTQPRSDPGGSEPPKRP